MAKEFELKKPTPSSRRKFFANTFDATAAILAFLSFGDSINTTIITGKLEENKNQPGIQVSDQVIERIPDQTGLIEPVYTNPLQQAKETSIGRAYIKLLVAIIAKLIARHLQ